MNQTQEVRKLIDKHFSLDWCRNNIVIPLSVETAAFPDKQRLIVAVGNFSYLATIGEFIKKQAAHANLECQFIEKPADQIQALLDEASTQRLISGEGLENYEYADDAILEALKAAEVDTNPDGFDFVFDESEEFELVDETLDLSSEMMGSKIQQAAANILIHSTRNNVSDIHIEPRNDMYMIRLRVDGILSDFLRVPRQAGLKLTACVKNMAKLDIAERRAAQDGKICRRFEGKKMVFRCSTAPGNHGEKTVLRILKSDDGMLDLDNLIVNEEVRKKFRDIINQANGIVIVSGPTGSGKSTTLASALREKDTGEWNIVTAEDPIEYDMGGTINQFQVIRAKGQTFAKFLQTFLRQDPDVILIGETRDPETAESSMDAAETGHLVFTTLHANSASTSLTRLLDMEVPSYKLTSSLRGVLAQRLLRMVCPECSIKRPINDLESEFTGLRRGTEVRVATTLKVEDKEQRKRERTLCPRCNGTGYKGRIGTYELMKINTRISDAIKQKKSTREIEDIAVEGGMLTLKAYAVDLIKKQLTTVSELQKICNT